MPTGNRDGSRSRLPPQLRGKPPSDRDYKNFMKWSRRERHAGRPQWYDRYHSHQVQTRTFAKQEMLHSWLVSNLEKGDATVQENFSNTVTVQNSIQQGWVTEAVLGGPDWLNDPSQAQVVFNRPRYQENLGNKRLHEDPDLAAAGVNEIWYVKKLPVTGSQKRQVSQTSAAVATTDLEMHPHAG